MPSKIEIFKLGGRKPMESATEKIPPGVSRRVRVKLCGKSAHTGQVIVPCGKPHLEQDKIGAESFPAFVTMHGYVAERNGCRLALQDTEFSL